MIRTYIHAYTNTYGKIKRKCLESLTSFPAPFASAKKLSRAPNV